MATRQSARADVREICLVWHRHDTSPHALDDRAIEIDDRGRSSLLELDEDGVVWTARVPVGEMLIAEERGVFARVLRREVELGHRAFDARFFLVGDVGLLAPHTRDALLELPAPLEVRVRAGHAIVRAGGPVDDVVGALLLLWSDLDPPTRAAGAYMHGGFAPDLPPASAADIDAIDAAGARALDDAARRRERALRSAAVVKPKPPRVKRVLPQPQPQPKARVRPAPAAASAATTTTKPRPQRAPKAQPAPATALDMFEPILPSASERTDDDVVRAAVRHGAGTFASAIERVEDGVLAKLTLAGDAEDGELFVVDDAELVELRASAPAPATQGSVMLRPQHTVTGALTSWLIRDDQLGHDVLDRAFVVDGGAGGAPAWLVDVAGPLLALRSVDLTVVVDAERITLASARFRMRQHALAPLVAAATTVLYVASRARAGLV